MDTLSRALVSVLGTYINPYYQIGKVGTVCRSFMDAIGAHKENWGLQRKLGLPKYQDYKRFTDHFYGLIERHSCSPRYSSFFSYSPPLAHDQETITHSFTFFDIHCKAFLMNYFTLLKTSC